MAKIVVAGVERERLDRIAAAGLGSERDGGIEALLGANPGLAAGGPYVPQGTRLNVPQVVVRPGAGETPTRPWE